MKEANSSAVYRRKSLGHKDLINYDDFWTGVCT